MKILYLPVPRYIWFYLTISPHISLHFVIYGERETERYGEIWKEIGRSRRCRTYRKDIRRYRRIYMDIGDMSRKRKI